MLGGGFVCGAVYMVHGEPGAGKSTMLAQAASAVRGSVYASVEEDLKSVADRCVRLGLRDDMILLSEPGIDALLAIAGHAVMVVIDSIQMSDGDSEYVVKQAVSHARKHNVVMVLVCHETKSGAHAGARKLEHMVDCSLKIQRQPRGLVVEKNRFGAAGIWLPLEMTAKGFEYNPKGA